MAFNAIRLMKLISNRRITIALLTAWLMLGAGGISVSFARADDPFAEYDLVMLERPSLPKSEVSVTFADGLIPLWTKALDRPDPALQRMTIDTIAIAHQRGVPGMDQAAAKIRDLIQLPDQDRDIVISAARALVVMNDQDSAELLAAVSQKRGDAVAKIVEPALATWQSDILKEQWLDRLKQTTASDDMMLLAIDGVAAIDADEASASLQNIVQNQAAPAAIRLKAAATLGTIDSSQATNLASDLLVTETETPPSVLPSLVAVRLLKSDDSPATVKTLESLSRHPISVVQAASLGRLLEIDPALVDELADELISSNDVNIRRHCVRAMLHQPKRERIAAIAPLLDDINPSLRREVRNGLLDWSRDGSLKDEVINQTMLVLQNDSWQGCEQASVILAKLDHKPAGRRMADLLGHPRGEVKVATAWGLTQLRDPEYLPAMLQHAESVQEGFASGQLNDDMPGVTLQMAHLFIAFGDQMYAPAESVLRAYLPKNLTWGTQARAAACWATGLLLAEEKPDDVLKVVTERYRDYESLEPEEDDFRVMCAILFGRWKSESRLPDLAESDTGSPRFAQACYWAIEKMTGEKPLTPKIRAVEKGEWFLSPIMPQ